MRRVLQGALGERFGYVLRRPGLGVSAAEIDKRIALDRRLFSDASQQAAEVLRRHLLDSSRPPAHRTIVLSRSGGLLPAAWRTSRGSLGARGELLLQLSHLCF